MARFSTSILFLIFSCTGSCGAGLSSSKLKHVAGIFHRSSSPGSTPATALSPARAVVSCSRTLSGKTSFIP